MISRLTLPEVVMWLVLTSLMYWVLLWMDYCFDRSDARCALWFACACFVLMCRPRERS